MPQYAATDEHLKTLGSGVTRAASILAGSHLRLGLGKAALRRKVVKISTTGLGGNNPDCFRP
jgi:hypothetical protein